MALMQLANAAAKLDTISATPLRGYCCAVSRDARKYLPTLRQAARSNL